MDKKELDLINGAINGNETDLKKLIKYQQPKIYSMILYLKKDDIDILDIVQNVLIKLSKNIKNLHNPLSFKTWLNQITINAYNDYLRKKIKDKLFINQFQSALKQNVFDDIADYTTNPQDAILNNEIKNLIKKSINNLPTHYKIPLTLRDIEGLSYNRISEITKKSIGTIKSRISRARTLVQTEIEKYNKR